MGSPEAQVEPGKDVDLSGTSVSTTVGSALSAGYGRLCSDKLGPHRSCRSWCHCDVPFPGEGLRPGVCRCPHGWKIQCNSEAVTPGSMF